MDFIDYTSLRQWRFRLTWACLVYFRLLDVRVLFAPATILQPTISRSPTSVANFLLEVESLILRRYLYTQHQSQAQD